MVLPFARVGRLLASPPGHTTPKSPVGGRDPGAARRRTRGIRTAPTTRPLAIALGQRSQRSEALPGFALRRDDGSGGDGRTTPCHSGTNDVPGKRRKKHRLQSSLLRYITTKT